MRKLSDTFLARAEMPRFRGQQQRECLWKEGYMQQSSRAGRKARAAIAGST